MALDIPNLPALITSATGIPLIGTQILLSAIVILSISLPIVILSQGRNPLMLGIFFGLGLLLCYGIGWLDVWIVLILIILDSGILALIARDVLT